MTVQFTNMSYEDYLEHYGVKGMKWGKRNSKSSVELADGYSKGQHRTDTEAFGKKRAAKINKRVAGGMDLKTARKKAGRSRDAATLVKFGAAYVGALAVMNAPYLMDRASVGVNTATLHRQQQNRKKAGAKVAADLFSDSRGIGNYPTVRLNYDRQSDSWG